MLSWLRTKLNVYFNRVILPHLEALLVWYLKFSGERNVEKFWRKQLTKRRNNPRTTSEKAAQRCKGSAGSFEIILATWRDHHARVNEISGMVNRAYVRELKDALLNNDCNGDAVFSRTTPVDIERRLISDLEMQQLQSHTEPPLLNRVLFLAVLSDGSIVGTCAATLSAPWCPSGAGSWGLLAVSQARMGIGQALVRHCEQYIRLAMLERIRIEYFYIANLPSSEILRKWYEDRLGYECFKAHPMGRSYRGNEVKGEVIFRHCDLFLRESEDVDPNIHDNLSQKQLFQMRKARLAKFLLASMHVN
mmetsp:Transcript_104542/g.164981  ORF Transcript_104542/g.164981 Transcript_104542/m.164981 type:complete len:305 (+) Transcript_104542:32-946(+)